MKIVEANNRVKKIFIDTINCKIKICRQIFRFNTRSVSTLFGHGEVMISPEQKQDGNN